MKLLTDGEIFEIASVDDANITTAQEKLRPVVENLVEWDWLWRGVKNGFYKAAELRKNGEAIYRYFYHLNDQNFLNVNASLFVGNGKGEPMLWYLGVNMIGRCEKARGIVCTTNRRGHIEQCERVGFKIVGVQLWKEFDL